MAAFPLPLCSSCDPRPGTGCLILILPIVIRGKPPVSPCSQKFNGAPTNRLLYETSASVCHFCFARAGENKKWKKLFITLRAEAVRIKVNGRLLFASLYLFFAVHSDLSHSAAFSSGEGLRRCLHFPLIILKPVSSTVLPSLCTLSLIDVKHSSQ